MKTTHAGAVAIGLIALLASCTAGESQDTPATSTPEPVAVETPSQAPPTTTANPASTRAEMDAEQRSSAERLFLLTARGATDVGSASDSDLIAAGDMTCDGLDDGLGFFQATALTVTALPDDGAEDAPILIGATATYDLCPEHEGALQADTQG